MSIRLMPHTPDTLAAQAEIRDVVYLYARAIDRREWSLLEQVFHPDAGFSALGADGTWQEFMRQAEEVVTPLIITQHYIGNILITQDGDVASSEAYLQAYHQVPPDYPTGLSFPSTGKHYDLILGGRYIDRFERRNKRWKIAHRTLTFDWRQETPTVLPQPTTGV